MKNIFLFIVLAMVLTACGKNDEPENIEDNPVQEDNQVDINNDNQKEEDQDDIQKEPSGYSFEYKDLNIFMNMDVAPVINNLGEALEYFEAESCAFKGLDKTYTYPGFEITTYPLNGSDNISSIYIMDDSVSTPEGIYLGASVDEMIAAYGDDYTESSGAYTYTKDDSKLQFITKDNEIIAITYLADVEGLE
jgi:hypothetical protein